jgi:hypothetical protein
MTYLVHRCEIATQGEIERQAILQALVLELYYRSRGIESLPLRHEYGCIRDQSSPVLVESEFECRSRILLGLEQSRIALIE